MSTKANQKKSEKPSLPKTTFFGHFGDFGVSPRAILVKILGFGVPFWLEIGGKSENRDFVKIVLLLWK